MNFKKLLNLGWLIIVWFLYDISYDGIIKQSIHHDTPRININFDGNEAVVFGVMAFFAGTYLLYLVLELLKKEDTNI